MTVLKLKDMVLDLQDTVLELQHAGLIMAKIELAAMTVEVDWSSGNATTWDHSEKWTKKGSTET